MILYRDPRAIKHFFRPVLKKKKKTLVDFNDGRREKRRQSFSLYLDEFASLVHSTREDSIRIFNVACVVVYLEGSRVVLTRIGLETQHPTGRNIVQYDARLFILYIYVIYEPIIKACDKNGDNFIVTRERNY